jgi:hypothetical protein
MVGLLFALPNTQVTCRLKREGRLRSVLPSSPEAAIDQATQGLNFDTIRPREEILSDFKHVLEFKRVLETVYEPGAYSKRLQRAAGLLGSSSRNRRASADDARSRIDALGIVPRILSNLPQGQDVFRLTTSDARRPTHNGLPRSSCSRLFTFIWDHSSRQVIRQIEQQLDELRTAAPTRGGPTERCRLRNHPSS